MANLQVRDIDDQIYEALKKRAKQQHRSLSQEIVHIIEEYLSRPNIDSPKQTELFLQLVGAWQGPESAEEILTSIRKGRIESKRFKGHMAYLIDTDIIIYSIKGNLKVQQRFREKEAIPKAISIITYGELLYGAKKSSQPEKNAAIVYRLAEIFPVVGITRSIIETFAEIKRSFEIRGERLADLDLLIASTALSLNYTLVTNNTQHFQRIKGLKLENWTE